MSIGVISSSAVISGGGGGTGDAAYTAAVMADSPAIWNRLDEVGAVFSAATASSAFGGEGPEKAFDSDVNTPWTSGGTVSWLRVQLASAVAISTYMLYSRPGWPSRAATNWTFEGSNDGTTFTVLDTHTGVTWSNAEAKAYAFANTVPYLYYRFNVNGVNGGSLADLAELALPFVKDASGNNRMIGFTVGVLPTLASDGPVLPRSLQWGSSAGFIRSIYSQAQPSIGTFEIWVKYVAAPAGTLTLVSWSPTTVGGFSDGNGNSYVQLLSNGKIRFGVAIGGGPGTMSNLDSPSALGTGVWHHVAGSWGPAGNILRIDGITVASGAVTSSYIGPEAANFRVHGRFVSGGTDGEQTGAVQLAEAAFYATQLSTARTDAHYLAASPTSSGYSAAVLADAPLGFWRLGDSTGLVMSDSSGNARDGAYNSNVALNAAGLLLGDPDKAATFNGSNAYGEVAYASWMDTPTAMTVEAWVKTTGSGLQAIVDRDDGSSQRAWQFRLNGGNLEFIKISSGVVTAATTGLSLNDGKSHHVAATYDGSNIRLYVDGALFGSPVSAPGSLTGARKIQIGVNDGGTAWYVGVIDEAAFYGTVLTAARIAAHYSAGSSWTWDFRNLSALPTGWARSGVASETFDAAGMQATYAASQFHYLDLPRVIANGTLEAKMVSGPSNAMLGPAVQWTPSSQGANISWYNAPNGALLLGVNGSYFYDSSFSTVGAGGAGTYPVWFRLRFNTSLNTVYGSFSTDGITYSAEVSLSRLGMGGVGRISVGSILNPNTGKFEYVKWTTP